MTQNQINWLQAREQQRHNYAMEAETKRHDVAEESISTLNLNELHRHQMVTEGQTDFSNIEQQRHNIQSEAAGFISAQGALARGQAALNTAAELARHNTVAEEQGWISTSADLSLKTAQANKAYSDAAVNVLSQEESVRHNKELEKQGMLGWFNTGTDLDLKRQSNQIASDKVAVEQQNADTNKARQISDMWNDSLRTAIAGHNEIRQSVNDKLNLVKDVLTGSSSASKSSVGFTIN